MKKSLKQIAKTLLDIITALIKPPVFIISFLIYFPYYLFTNKQSEL